MKSFFALKVVCASILVLACTVLAFPQAGLAQTTEIILNGGDCTVPLNDGAAVEINPATGNVEATTSDPDFCSGTSSTAEVTVDPLMPNPSQIQQGSSFTVNLNSLGARECRRTGLEGTNWPTSLPEWISPTPNGSFTVEIPTNFPISDPENPERMAYQCRNGNLTDQAGANIEVTEDDNGGDQSCTDVRPDFWSRDNRILANSGAITETWADVFDGFGFPESNPKNIAVQRFQYAALAFDPAGVSADESGTIGSIPIPNIDIPFGTALFSISPCPGDFRPDVLGACLQEVNTNLPFRWTADSGASDCELPGAETLYFNIAYGKIAGDGITVSSRCTSESPLDQPDECGSRISAE